ncbi:nicotinate-nucleotide adenylyltransferase [Marinobacter sp. S0848L]|uniref:nicotinate-nucleotide adenylyltransferase n=1 Tax=Marinobacter sp. S0848L TaxID=2926423 RepID=UPI001FF5EB75|nr:nicotinate-nucleotide adenylyltransferase [Marinobacter sp. S0848L]MCK0106146.1 nicotinate-nucleotide adenylyltransferase [Marinobacter sp. S0848L]
MYVIYGGTFDPIHHGHLRLALEVAEVLQVPQVNLVPCHIPPHRGDTGASSAQRLEMIALAIEGEAKLRVDDRELRRAGASYTADTLRQLRQDIGPDEPLVMLVGTDAFASFDRWREWQDIPALAHIIVVKRPGSDLPEGSVAKRLLEEHRAATAKDLCQAPAGKILEFDAPLIEISATGIRQRISCGHSPRYLLPDSVLQRIHEHGLYGACPDRNF